MTANLDNFKNIYLPELKTAEDVLKFMEKGMFFKQNRQEEIFYKRFINLKRKIHKVLLNECVDDFDYEVYVNSILIDCRALFLENSNKKFNGTLQGSYKARNLDKYAKCIDDFFNRDVIEGISLKVVIKDWVDKMLAHADYLEPENEEFISENILLVIDRNTLSNIFHGILHIAQQYEEIRGLYGKNAGEQLEITLSLLTG